ncbi:SH3 domain-containing protein [Bartonella rattaustraliani]|uniref:SH3 domain-containing protein n=1 Tax=Bartonella rattaustraliani TaxID=481139 RepID=UPI00035FDDCA|nr:SH3 domain-containing protein [Bartonella rattaustraliani]
MKKLIFFFVFGPFLLSIAASKAENPTDAFVIRNLNLRTGPNTQYAVRGLIPIGELIFVQACQGNWCYIKYNTQIGWVSSRYLSFKDGNDLYRTYTIFPITNESQHSYSP